MDNTINFNHKTEVLQNKPSSSEFKCGDKAREGEEMKS